jgi:4-amino-4-deoxy-L-arabinose transferase-like glycosyltransferase
MQTERPFPPVALPAGVRALAPALRRHWPQLALGAVAVLAAVLDFWNLSVNGLGNSYYAQAVRSMTESWQAFRYAALDAQATITVDKPPLAFWIQAASARLFGYSSWSLLGPSVAAGAISVAVLGRTVTRVFGVWAGLLAAVVMALTPVVLVDSRSNNTDAILVVMLVLGTWAGVRALESGRWRWVALAAVFFGLGFLTKMLAAFIVLPGLVAAYLVMGPRRLPVRLAQLLAAAGILTAISLGWMLSVDLTPAADRPRVGSSPNNTEMGLAFGWNGLERIFGGSPGGGSDGPGGGGPIQTGQGPGGSGSGPAPTAEEPGGGPGAATLCANGSCVKVPAGEVGIPRRVTLGGPGGGDVPAAFGGPSGFTRLLTGMLGAQGSWLLPLAALGLVSALVAVGLRRRGVQLAGLVVFGGWTIVVWAIFSYARGVFHPYYINELAPGVAALVGVGAVALWRDGLAGGWRALLPAAALLGTALFEWALLRSESTMGGWGWALVAISALLALGLLVRHLARRRLQWRSRRGLAIAATAAGVGLAALLAAPAAFDWEVVTTATTGAIPIAQPPGSRAQSGGAFIADAAGGGPGGAPPGARSGGPAVPPADR